MVFGSQSTLDDIIDNLSCMLKVPRWKLHIVGTFNQLRFNINTWPFLIMIYL